MARARRGSDGRLYVRGAALLPAPPHEPLHVHLNKLCDFKTFLAGVVRNPEFYRPIYSK